MANAPAPRRLTPDDAEAICALRQQALLDAPWAFEMSPDEDYSADPNIVRRNLADENAAILAMPHPDEPARLIAMTGVVRSTKAKSRHRAHIWGVFCDPAHRRRGCARAVLQAAIDHAFTWPGVEVISLAVSENAPAAQALYESLGFQQWGREPDALRVGGKSYTEIYLQFSRGK